MPAPILRNGLKRCRGCDSMKPFAEFGKSARALTGLSNQCSACMKARNAAYYEANRARCRAVGKAWKARQPKHPRVLLTKEQKLQRSRAYSAKWRAKNLERARARTRMYMAKNPGHAAKHARLWRQRHPEADRAHTYKKRSRGGRVVSREDVVFISALRKDPCSYCGKIGKMQMDHIVPLVYGGDPGWENLTAACSSCNARKNDRPLLRWLMVSA